MYRNKTLSILVLLIIAFITTSCSNGISKFGSVEKSSLAPQDNEGQNDQKPPVCDLTSNDMINNQCVVKCAVNQTRNTQGVCINNTVVCNANQEIFNNVCVAKCGTNQTRNAQGQCVTNSPTCNLATHEMINSQCVVKCAANQTRNAQGQCVATQCSNGASNFPGCDDCGAGKHLESGMCVSNSRACLSQPQNSAGGYQSWANGSWSACQNFSCNQGHFLDNGLCVQGCEAPGQTHSWGLFHIGGIELRCSGNVPRLREGQSTSISSNNGNPGSIKVTCTNSQFVFASEPQYQSHTNNDVQRYMLKIFRNESVDITCNNQLIKFQTPRLWESCLTASTADCFAALGSQPTEINACQSLKVYADDLGIYKTTLIEGKYLGQHFGTRYRVTISTSKDNFATAYDVTEDIVNGYGKMLDSQNPQELYDGKPPGFSLVTRKGMENQQIKIAVHAATYLNGSIRQSGVGETIIKVRPNSDCTNEYDGRGVANFVVGQSLPNETPETALVRKGYPFRLHP